MISVSPARMLLLLMLLHYVADFTLQGLLMQLKQRSWWGDQLRKPGGWGTFEAMFQKYRFDYKTANVCHALYWTLVTFAPIVLLDARVGDVFAASCVLLNTAFHAVVDDLKANKFAISLLQDQVLHVFQILATWLAWVLIF